MKPVLKLILTGLTLYTLYFLPACGGEGGTQVGNPPAPVQIPTGEPGASPMPQPDTTPPIEEECDPADMEQFKAAPCSKEENKISLEEKMEVES